MSACHGRYFCTTFEVFTSLSAPAAALGKIDLGLYMFLL